MKRYLCLVLSPFLVALMGGCSPYVEGFHYAPRPAVAEVPATQPQTPPPLSVFVSVVGVHNPDKDQGIPLSVEVRLRFENNGPQTVVFDPSSLELLDGGLMKFPPPVVFPNKPITLQPDQGTVIGAFSPFPPGHDYHSTDLEALRIHWDVALDGHGGEQGVDFHRVHAYYAPYYDPYPAYPYPYYGGVIVIHGGRRW